MRVTLQRVQEATVKVDQRDIGHINQGLLLFVGIAPTDNEVIVTQMAQKISKLRIFEDQNGKMNLNVQQVSGGLLSISQFTLYADVHKGNRPSFQAAACPDLAKKLYQCFNQQLQQFVQIPIATGIFGADMQIQALNDGPVTINLELEHA